MIIIFEDGRLGNQIFQYAALKNLYPNQKFVFFGFGKLRKAFKLLDGIFIENFGSSRFLISALRSFFTLLTKLRIIGSMWETFDNTNHSITLARGVLFEIYLLKQSYFQHQQILPSTKLPLQLKDQFIQEAEKWLRQKGIVPGSKNLVFMHVRRGDYLYFPNPEFPAVLDLNWYVRAMEKMRSVVKNPIFLIVTDDTFYAHDCFESAPDVLISKNDQFVDFALMSLCCNGILSCSSFGWWGANLSKAQSFEPGVYFAPKFWCGHRKQEWFPSGFITDWITYIE